MIIQDRGFYPNMEIASLMLTSAGPTLIGHLAEKLFQIYVLESVDNGSYLSTLGGFYCGQHRHILTLGVAMT